MTLPLLKNPPKDIKKLWYILWALLYINIALVFAERAFDGFIIAQILPLKLYYHLTTILMLPLILIHLVLYHFVLETILPFSLPQIFFEVTLLPLIPYYSLALAKVLRLVYLRFKAKSRKSSHRR